MPEEQYKTGGPNRLDASMIEADIAFFDARLSLAARRPGTVYQQAQIKTYRTLGQLLGKTLETLRDGK